MKKTTIILLVTLALVGAGVAWGLAADVTSQDISKLDGARTQLDNATDAAGFTTARDAMDSAVDTIDSHYNATTDTTTATTTKTTTTDTTTTDTTPDDVTLVDKSFVCDGPVNIEGTVNVTITANANATDAVLLRKGCSGYIGNIVVTQYKGDGIKVGDAGPLVVGGGTIRCYDHSTGKHQDGVQLLGGHNITFNDLDVGCYSANNSQIWANEGSGGNNPPTNVVFDGGHFQGLFNGGQYGPGGAYGVAFLNTVNSGIRNAVICPNAHPKRELVFGNNPPYVNDNNDVRTSC